MATKKQKQTKKNAVTRYQSKAAKVSSSGPGDLIEQTKLVGVDNNKKALLSLWKIFRNR